MLFAIASVLMQSKCILLGGVCFLYKFQVNSANCKCTNFLHPSVGNKWIYYTLFYYKKKAQNDKRATNNDDGGDEGSSKHDDDDDSNK